MFPWDFPRDPRLVGGCSRSENGGSALLGRAEGDRSWLHGDVAEGLWGGWDYGTMWGPKKDSVQLGQL